MKYVLIDKVSENYLRERLKEIENELMDFHISSFRYDELIKEKKIIYKELEKR